MSNIPDSRLNTILKVVEDFTFQGFSKDEQSLEALSNLDLDNRSTIVGLTRWMIADAQLGQSQVMRASRLANMLDPATHDAINRPINPVTIKQLVAWVDPFERQKQKKASPEARYRLSKKA